MSSRKPAILVASITLSALFVGCSSFKSTSEPVSELSAPQTVKVAYQEAACTQLAPQLVMLARQEHQLTSAKGKGSASTLADTRRQKEELRSTMRSSGCF